MQSSFISGPALFEASGFSMWPSIQQSDRLMVEPVAVTLLAAGDLVVYSDGERRVCHRFIRLGQAKGKTVLLARQDYYTQWKTEIVPLSRLQGRVAAIIRGNKIISTKTARFRAQALFLVFFSPLISGCINFAKRFKRR